MTPEHLTKLQDLHDELGKLIKSAVRTGKTLTLEDYYEAARKERERVHSYVGLFLGEHDECLDANYARQPCTLVYDSYMRMWVNEHAVHFPPFAATRGVDSIVVEGGDIRRPIKARMERPIVVESGNGVGYVAGALTVHADIMRIALSLPNRVPPHGPPAEDVSPPEANAKAIERAREALTKPPAPPVVRIPAFCDRCERVTVQKYNQLVAMGYQVNHLIELPGAAGYAVPCTSCRK